MTNYHLVTIDVVCLCVMFVCHVWVSLSFHWFLEVLGIQIGQSRQAGITGDKGYLSLVQGSPSKFYYHSVLISIPYLSVLVSLTPWTFRERGWWKEWTEFIGQT